VLDHIHIIFNLTDNLNQISQTGCLSTESARTGAKNVSLISAGIFFLTAIMVLLFSVNSN